MTGVDNDYKTAVNKKKTVKRETKEIVGQRENIEDAYI